MTEPDDFFVEDDYTMEDHMEAMDQVFAATVMDDLAWWGFDPKTGEPKAEKNNA